MSTSFLRTFLYLMSPFFKLTIERNNRERRRNQKPERMTSLFLISAAFQIQAYNWERQSAKALEWWERRLGLCGLIHSALCALFQKLSEQNWISPLYLITAFFQLQTDNWEKQLRKKMSQRVEEEEYFVYEFLLPFYI